MSSLPALEVEGLRVAFPGTDRPALDGVDLRVEPGGRVALVGPVGSGRTTLLHAIAGVIPAFTPAAVEGTIRIAGRDRRSLSVADDAGLVGIVFDDPEPRLSRPTVAEEVALGLESLAVPRGEMRRRVADVLALVRLDGLAERVPTTLSGGEQARLALAAALVLEPALLLLDEPLAQVDPEGRESILALLDRFARERGLAWILAATDAPEAGQVDRIVRLGANTNVQTDEARRARHAPPDAPPTVELRDVTVIHPGGTRALDGVSLALAPGEVVGLVGPNGAGKSTLARLLVGLVRPTGGRVVVAGHATSGRPTRELARQVGLVLQEPRHQLLTGSVHDELALGPRNLGIRGDALAERVAATAERFGLEPLLDRHPLRLGLADRRLVAIAAVAAMGTPILVLDEPAANLDAPRIRLLERAIATLAGAGTTVLLVAHDLDLVERVAHRVVRLEHGRVVA